MESRLWQILLQKYLASERATLIGTHRPPLFHNLSFCESLDFLVLRSLKLGSCRRKKSSGDALDNAPNQSAVPDL
jgi:hypothetical protein